MPESAMALRGGGSRAPQVADMKGPEHTSALPSHPDDAHFRLLVDAVREYAIFTLDPQGHVMSWNTGAELIMGYTADEMFGKHYSQLYSAESVERGIPTAVLASALKTGRVGNEDWHLHKDGTPIWANDAISALIDPSGHHIGFAVITRECSGHHQHETSVQRSEQRLQLLIQNVRDYAIFVLDPQGIVVSWNEGAQHINGYRAGEILGSHVSRFYPSELIALGKPELELHRAALSGRCEDEGWRVRKDGSRFWASDILTALRDSSGILQGFAKITRDLTERRQAEETRRRAEERYRILIEGVTEYAIIMIDANGLICGWNPGAELLCGYRADQIIDQHVSVFYSADDIQKQAPRKHLAAARKDGRIAEHGWRVRKDGTLFFAGCVVSALHDAAGNPYGFAYVMQDLTTQRHAEVLAAMAQRMQEFVVLLARELKSPLLPIANAVALMAKRCLHDPALEAMRQTIERQSLHLTRLLDDLLNVDRIGRGALSIAGHGDSAAAMRPGLRALRVLVVDDKQDTAGRLQFLMKSMGHNVRILGDGESPGMDQRRELVAMTAYYLAERRGFEPGHEVEDWEAAEAMVLANFRATEGAGVGP